MKRDDDMTNAQFPKILTLSGTIPGEPGVGGVILDDLRSGVPEGTLQFIPAVTQQVIGLGWLDRGGNLAGHVVRRYETAWRRLPGIAGESMAWAARKVLFERHCRHLVSQICRHPAALSCDKIWAVLDCPTVIETAAKVATLLNKPLVVMVWDTPELLVDQLRMDRWSAANLLTRFGRTIQQAQRVGVICERMRDHYRRRFGGGPYVILRHGTGQELWHPPGARSKADRIVIGFAGSITAQQPFAQLVEVLNDSGWQVSGKQVTLRMIGSRYLLDSRVPQHIEYFGWRSLEDTVALLAECDMLYLPQPFAEHLRPLAELSFPTKLTTYLAAGRRVLLHAPPYASITPFIQQYPIGLSCTQLDTSALRACLERLDQMPAEPLADAIAAARRDEFNSDVFQRRFAELAGLDAKRPSSGSIQQRCGAIRVQDANSVGQA